MSSALPTPSATSSTRPRKARNLRQSDLAELSGIAQSDISRIERGHIAPTVPTLLKLADALGAQIQLVLPSADDASPHADAAHEVFRVRSRKRKETLEKGL